ncbi:uncharacterized protein BXZ73DRAFT_78878 [Epithele typhae]|uniref:uncharacterized protein n=1 Tax=Epithele typhae TaxID=378194 RepID=UPI0020083451|nr:uncharacterized protein BXZ73DRAFT_78878 [Epithele typhae]KAH9925899.1 hypothetical protein BXZ73DRAFT_78878 [Epithele typhae]
MAPRPKVAHPTSEFRARELVRATDMFTEPKTSDSVVGLVRATAKAHPSATGQRVFDRGGPPTSHSSILGICEYPRLDLPLVPLLTYYRSSISVGECDEEHESDDTHWRAASSTDPDIDIDRTCLGIANIFVTTPARYAHHSRVCHWDGLVVVVHIHVLPADGDSTSASILLSVFHGYVVSGLERPARRRRIVREDVSKASGLMHGGRPSQASVTSHYGFGFFLMLPARSAASPQLKALANIVCGAGDTKVLITNFHHIGDWVARIVDDPRTLNRSVMVWEDEVTQMEALAIAGSISGEGVAFEATRTSVRTCLQDPHRSRTDYAARQMDRETFEKMDVEATAAIAADPSVFANHVTQSWAEYVISMHFLRENTLENAKALGYLDAQELYPDAPAQSLEEFAKEFYALEDPGLAITR